jgi:type II secretory pathway pseudopilin PulG
MQSTAATCQPAVAFRLKSPGQLAGFTFLGLMIIIAIMGVALLAVGEVWHFASKRAKEQELLFVGHQFRQALKLYSDRASGPNKQQAYPMTLEDLLKDPRFPSTQRYLRKIYLDPITGNKDWGVTRAPNGGINGVFSLSEETPIKQSNFRLADKDFEGKTKYSDWIFMRTQTAASAIPPGPVRPGSVGSTGQTNPAKH